MNKFIPKIKVSTSIKRPAWMSIDIKKNIKKKYKLFKKYLESKNSYHYHEYRIFRNKLSKEVKQAKYLHEQIIAQDCKANPKIFWKYVNSKRKCKEGISALKVGNVILTENHDKAKALNDFFTSVFTEEYLTNLPNLPPGSKSQEVFSSFIHISEDAVRDKLDKLNINKSPGPDKIYPRVLKVLSGILAGPIAHIFNASLEAGVLPDEWKIAEVTAIFKKGSKTDPGNYRPVSLTCILCKLMESFIRDAIQDHMEDLNLYSSCQHGFRKKRSCISQLLRVMENFTKLIDEGQSFDTVYLDFRKAFDTVPHERLLTKLESYGITGPILQWVRAFLSGRSQYVRVGDKYSSTSPVTSGIPQGSILGPILFLIFINDLPDCVESICLIFADDTKIFNTSCNHSVLQSDLNKLKEWSELWQIYFNNSKCKCIYYGHNNPENEYHFKTCTGLDHIAKGTEEKDLGVIFDPSLKFDLHINAAIKKANSILGLIKRSFSYIDDKIFLQLYKALVRPHLEYGQAVWYPHLSRQELALEKVQKRATKLVPSLRHLSYTERLKALNLPSLSYRRIRGDMILVYNLFSQDSWNSLLERSETVSTRGHDFKLYKSSANTNMRKYAFSQRVVTNWNNLSLSTVHAPNINSFKKLLDLNCKNIYFNNGLD